MGAPTSRLGGGPQPPSAGPEYYLLNTVVIANLSFVTYRVILSNGTSSHDLTPIGIGDEHFLARLMLFFNVQWNIFNKQVPQAVA